ncbi:GntR family transcriptional regulator [Phyllobacterium sp. SB3]|uniref:GntR family transcriptional regulator n=1 Tax=Phyllobacterium sp. SB3 TaxID=3156073 RepID=UPI0032AF94C0
MMEPIIEETRTLASSTYSRLREDILRAELTPGSKLNIRALCVRFNVGLSPVREALSRLSSEGLVRRVDQRGFTVADLSSAELVSLTRARCWINEIGLRRSIECGGLVWEEGLLLAFHRMQRVPRVEQDPHERSPAWASAHMHFHRALVCASGSDWITQFCDELFEAAERYRYFARRAERVRANVADEHEAIMSAAIAGDADLAVERLNAHFQHTAGLVEQALKDRT